MMMKYQGAWYKETKNQTVVVEFKPNSDWQPYERDQKAIAAVHRGADADAGILSYVHAIEWFGLRTRCLTHRPLKGFAIPWTPHRKVP